MVSTSKEAQLFLAIEALKRDPSLTVRKAASLYLVSKTTLLRQRDGILLQRDTNTNKKKLTLYEEQVLLQYILDLDSKGFPPRISAV